MFLKISNNIYSNFWHQLWSKKFSKLCPGIPRLRTTTHCQRQNHNWRRHMEYNNKRRKVIPNLVYLHNPWTYLITKFNLLKIQLLWDREFVETEFIRGAKQAAVVLTDTIRKQNSSNISKFTTPVGYQQITRDMRLSREDTRLKLVRFEAEHLRRAIPMKVVTRLNYGRKYCFIDMLFVGLRNTKDFETVEEIVEVQRILRTLDSNLVTVSEESSVPHRIVFAEIFMRFRRDCTKNGNDYHSHHIDNSQFANEKDWAVGFYKIISFDVFNYNPK